ncbi:MAG: hypothetical protein A3205_05660 [Methanomassiliicoccales archaeon Mx-03]|nr:MAG: hypothetical protein A3205_05660 [Methanomassiliicoccales archaeon Mx-03]
MTPSKYPKTEEDCLNLFMKSVESRQISDKTKYGYRLGSEHCMAVLREQGMETLPYLVGEKEINYLVFQAFENLAIRTKRWYLCMFNKFLLFFDNLTMQKMNLSWPHDRRVHVDWLDPQQARALLDMPMTIEEEVVIHLELCLGLRRVEVIRLRVSDIHPNYLDVRGKGRHGGKWRSIPFPEGTYELLQRMISARNVKVKKFREKHPNVEVPDTLFIRIKGREISPYAEKGTGFDSHFIVPLRKKAGFHFSNHTLRRTFGRQLWKNHVEIEKIAEIMGHESIDQTLQYIGVNMDDMSAAMSKLRY